MTAREFFGYALMAVGALIAGLCGLCTLTYFVMGAASLGKGGEEGGYAPIMMIASVVVGFVPIMVGIGLFVGGRSLRRPPPPRAGAFD